MSYVEEIGSEQRRLHADGLTAVKVSLEWNSYGFVTGEMSGIGNCIYLYTLDIPMGPLGLAERETKKIKH